MKIFGKVKSNNTGAAATETAASEKKDKSKIENEIDVQSYFASAESSSSKKKKPRKSDGLDGDNIEALLEMDFDKLNAKQRRLVKRHRAREGNQEIATDETKSSSTEDNPSKSGKPVQDEDQNATEVPKTDTNKKSSMDIADVVKKLDGLNSKERRKFLRQLKSNGEEIDEDVIAAAQEEARKVAERNEKEAVNGTPSKETSDKSGGGKRNASEPSGNKDEAIKPKKRRKKGPTVNLEELPPEERARREEQRRMQKEAAEKREAGLVDPSRHPLNSERRRANRRKPGKSALIAMAKKERMSEKGKFNAVGYQMRKG